MLLFKKTIISSEVAKNFVLPYQPKKVEIIFGSAAKDFVERQISKKSDFSLANPVRMQTGINLLEEKTIEDRVEQKALEKLKDVQEKAYKEAYDLGMHEGKNEAIKKYEEKLTEQIHGFGNLINSLQTLKQELFSQNEAQLIKLLFFFAQKIVETELEIHPELILPILKKSVEDISGDDEIKIKISKQDFEFIETIMDELPKDYGFIKEIQLEVSDDLSVGGCVVETNYGDVDSSLEQRVLRLSEAIRLSIPKIKNKVAS